MRDLNDMLAHGRRLAQERGCAAPTLRDAVWELLIEAADTLKRLPNQERRWLRSGTYSGHPEVLRELSDAFAAAVAQGGWGATRVRPGPPSAGAITRLDEVLTWPGAIQSRNRARDCRVVFALAAGVPVRVIRGRFGCGRQTVYDIRDRGLTQICNWLETRLASPPKEEALSARAGRSP